MAIFGLTSYDLKYAWRLCRKARKKARFIPEGAVKIVSDSDVGYVYKDKNRTFIVIDGSDNFLEWLKNFFWIRWGKDKVSAGFLKAAFEFSEQIKTMKIDSSVVCIGHSRGGAIVQEVALKISQIGINVESVVTFGSPKVGGFRFCRNMKSQGIFHIRVFAPNDPVPTLPKIRGRHYDSIRVTFEKETSIFDFYPVSKMIAGILEHVSYGALLDSKKQIVMR